MTDTAHATDGHLPAARKHLADAIHALTGRITGTVYTDGEPRIVFGDCLYDQLRDLLVTPAATERATAAGSQPPLFVDAADLLHTIDRGVYDMLRTIADTEPRTPTVKRLHAIEDHRWRPQDVNLMTDITRVITRWVSQARDLIDPPTRATLPNPCPACNTATVYRQDKTGETVRQPALQIGEHGCVCMNCRTTWAPDYFVHLARVLGSLPEGVLE